MGTAQFLVELLYFTLSNQLDALEKSKKVILAVQEDEGKLSAASR